LKLLVGLGNPGPQYELTRHNAGFLVIDAVAEKFGIQLGKTKFEASGGAGKIGDEPVVLLKPLTYMNLSGQSVRAASNYYRTSPIDIVVIHDDIDLEVGKVKTRMGGGHGGHNGIRSIMECLSSPDFQRIKLGIGRPPMDSKISVHDWVLGRFSDEELQRLTAAMLDEVLNRLKIALVSK
jgi:peptidyl-tRNA hydrolase, PTH1 family